MSYDILLDCLKPKPRGTKYQGINIMARLFITENQTEEPIDEIVFHIDNEGDSSSLLDKDEDGYFIIRDMYRERVRIDDLQALENALAKAKELDWY
jgi:hypothetical protein